MRGALVAVDRPPTARPDPTAAPEISALSIGSGWFPESPGGAENVYFHLARHLPACGVALRGLVPASDRAAQETSGRITGFAARGEPLARRLWRLRQAFRAAVRRQRPDLVATHFALYTLPCLDLIARRPLVIHFHGPWALEAAAQGAGPLTQIGKAAIERLSYGRGRRFIVLSEAFGDVLHRQYGAPRPAIRVVPGGVDCARFAIDDTRGEARIALSWEDDRPTILTVRRLVRRMGLRGLLAAMVEVRRAIPNVILHIAGCGPEARALAHEIERLELQRTVQLAGFIPDEALPRAYRAADLTIVPSVDLEGFGLTVIESLAAGTPVLVTPVGGLPETLRGLDPALVLSGKTPGELADGIVAALSGRLNLPTSATCTAYARRNFDWPVIAWRTRGVYDEALS
jgi:glycosyltransferase involved in cell wall biosynthesis